MQRFYSFVIPVYNRPREIRELLDSFIRLDTRDIGFEILIIEDGSDQQCEGIVQHYMERLPLSYYYKENSGPGDSRNFGMARAKGNYFIILDSDVLLPETYLQSIEAFLRTHMVDCFGGADRAHESFSPLQKAITFSMTSFLTTGGIRGKKRSMEKFKPRSFNMGLSKKAFQTLGGFSKMAVGEDLDVSVRLSRYGFQTAFIENAFVYHKRRISWRSFHQQVYKFGKGRPILDHRYDQFSLFSIFPTLFCIGLLASLILLLFGIKFFLSLYILYFLLIFVQSSMEYKSVRIGGLAIWSTIVQFYSYGLGYWQAFYRIKILGRKPEEAFPNLFFKEK